MECIAIINQKGGVGKTSTAVNLGAGLAQRGKRMLLIDLDPQGHLSTHFGLDGEAPGRGIYEVFTKNLPFEQAIHRYSPTISVVPSHVDLAAAEIELVSVVGREVILRDLLASKEWPYDIVMLDCPPSLGVLSLNALCASSHVLIPVQPHFLALQGAGKLFETISLVNHRLNARLKVAGMVMCLYDAATRLSAEVVDDLSSFLESSRGTPVPWRDARIFNTVIRRNVKLAECPSYGQSIFEYAPRSNGATDYLALADELLALLDGPPPAVSAPIVQSITSTAAGTNGQSPAGARPAADAPEKTENSEVESVEPTAVEPEIVEPESSPGRVTEVPPSRSVRQESVSIEKSAPKAKKPRTPVRKQPQSNSSAPAQTTPGPTAMPTEDSVRRAETVEKIASETDASSPVHS